MSQGFKVELNDMHGKLRSQASYAETDAVHPITYTENIYKVEDPNAESKRLSNEVYAIKPDGTIDTTALIGKDVELMVDMREQISISNANNINLNSDVFSVPFVPPVFLIPSFLNLAQREETQFRSVATVKIIQRYGILDSVIHIDKGSKVSTKDILYDAETGDALLTRTQNEFNDPIYNFSFPSHWAYDGMGLAYKNIGLKLSHDTFRNGKLISPLPLPDSLLFASGDQILVAGKIPTGDATGCTSPYSTFPAYDLIWAIDSNVLHNGPKLFYFLDKDGNPYNATDVSIQIIRSGRRNINTTVGAVTSLHSPLVRDTANQYRLLLDNNSNVVNASAATFKQFWNVQDQKKKKSSVTCAQFQPQDCINGGQSCTCSCLKKLFDYLIAYRRLFIQYSDNITVSTLVQNANAAGYSLNINDCQLLQQNANKPFYALTFDSVTNVYRAQLGDCIVSITAPENVRLYKLTSRNCDSTARVTYVDTVGRVIYDTLSAIFRANKSLNLYFINEDVEHLFPYTPPIQVVDTNTQKLISANKGREIIKEQEPEFTIYSFVKFDSLTLPANATIVNATFHFFADASGFHPTEYPNAHTNNHQSGEQPQFFIGVPIRDWDYNSEIFIFQLGDKLYTYNVSSTNEDISFDALPFINEWKQYGYYGIMMGVNDQIDSIRFSTFYSHRNSNINKRPRINLDYSYPITTPDSVIATLQVESCQACDSIVDNTCRSIVTDTAFNPYVTGALGNWRGNKNYTYYARRAESDPNTLTNIRTNGTFNDFTPYWKFQNGRLSQQEDTSRWVWNSQITMFNLKGFEIENKDPLGRYNSGLYGYSSTMPVAVIQNARFRESAFDGFEDYGFSTQYCDTSCSSDRHIDFSSYINNVDTVEKHSGKKSLRIAQGEHAAMTVKLGNAPQDTIVPSLTFHPLTNSCVTGGLTDVQASKTILLPEFSPYAGKKMVLSAWVKEQDSCHCNAYTNNRIVITFSGGTSFMFTPTGNVIEGWQRYESVFDIPANDTTMTLSLEATGTKTVYFDDLRIHPFNGNMKSFVYSSVNLRLMAELDENNYATFYEYDDDGTLIRVKKETERGVKTIKETRSALLKQ